MSQTEVINRAAKILHARRYGLKNPDEDFLTADAVLQVLTPKYGYTKTWDRETQKYQVEPPDQRQVKLYHQLVNQVHDLADSMVARPGDVERRSKKRGKRYTPLYPWASLDPRDPENSSFVYKVTPDRTVEMSRRYLTIAGINWSRSNRGEGWVVKVEPEGERRLRVWLVPLKEGRHDG